MSQIAEQRLPGGQPFAAAARAEPRGRLSARWRKLLLAAHVVIAVGLIGADLSVITLGITALTSGSPVLIRAGSLVMNILADNVMLPLAVGALVSGVLLGLVTKWGLARYYWVLVKLALTIVALTALVFVLRPRLDQAAAVALNTLPADLAAGTGPISLITIIGPAGALLILLINTILAYYKPWGQLRFRRN